MNKATEQVILKRNKTEAVPQKAVAETEDHFFVRTNYKMEKVIFQDIQYIESMREYISIHANSQRLVVNQTMN